MSVRVTKRDFCSTGRTRTSLTLSLYLPLACSCKIESAARVGELNDAELMHGLYVYVWMNLCILPSCVGDRKNSTAKNRDGWIYGAAFTVISLLTGLGISLARVY